MEDMTSNPRSIVDERALSARRAIRWPDRGRVPLRIEAVDPPHMISYRWCEHANATLTVASHSQGWTEELDKLVALLEGGS